MDEPVAQKDKNLNLRLRKISSPQPQLPACEITDAWPSRPEGSGELGSGDDMSIIRPSAQPIFNRAWESRMTRETRTYRRKKMEGACGQTDRPSEQKGSSPAELVSKSRDKRSLGKVA